MSESKVPPQVHIIETSEDFQAMMEYVSTIDNDKLILDVETNGIQEKQAYLWGVGFCFEEHEAFYVPFRDPRGTPFWNISTQKGIEVALINLFLSKKLIGHNIIFDILVLKNNLGVDLTKNIYSDTILLKHMIDEERPHGLKEVAEKYLGSWAVQAQADLYYSIEQNGGSTTKENCEMYKAETSILGKYCGWDTILCLKLFNLFSPRLKSEQLEKLFYEDEIMPVYKEVVIPMKDKGFHVDVPHLLNLRSELVVDISNLEKDIHNEINSYIDKFERIELWKEFGAKKGGNFPKALAEEINLELPIMGDKPVLRKKLLEHLIPKTPQQESYLRWILNDDKDDETFPKDLYVYATNAHRTMYEKKYPGEKIFNLNSTVHLSWLFFDRLGMTPTDYTDGGKPKLDAETLEGLAGQHKFADKIIVYKKLQKLLSTYVDGIMERQVDGILYTSMLLFGTTSGRFASRNPNLNNLPRLLEDDGKLNELIVKYTNAIRKALIAPDGYTMIGSDFSSLEPHIAAYVSGDEGLIDIFVKNQDFYSAIGIKQFNIKDASPYPSDPNYFGKKYKSLRSLIKTYALAAFYGATAPRISQVTGKTREESQELLNGYFSSFGGVKNFIETTHEQAMMNGCVYTLLGRVRHLFTLKGIMRKYGKRLLDWKWANNNGLLAERSQFRNLLNNAVNFQIQGYAAHCLNRAMIKMTRQFKEQKLDAWVALSIHDEVLVIAKNSDVDAAEKIVKNSMETCVDMNPIKLKATPIRGKSYADCK